MIRIVLACCWFLACQIGCKEKALSDSFPELIDGTLESAKDLIITYSDSGSVTFRIHSPALIKYEQDGRLVEEFPQGLLIEFYDEHKAINSTVYANYARRISADGTMHLRDSVVFVNSLQDRIESNSIVWDQANNEISTSKFFKLIRSSTLDTIFGIGMQARLDFSRMEVTQFESKSQYSTLNQ